MGQREGSFVHVNQGMAQPTVAAVAVAGGGGDSGVGGGGCCNEGPDSCMDFL